MKYPRCSALTLWLTLALLTLLSLVPAARAVDLTITAANVVPSASATTIRRVAAVAVTAGQLVYVESATNQLKLADCDSASAEVRKVAGIAVTSGAIGTMISVVVKDPALVLGATTAKGTIYTLSATGGGIAPVADITTGWYPHVIALGISTTVVAFDAGGLQSSVAN